MRRTPHEKIEKKFEELIKKANRPYSQPWMEMMEELEKLKALVMRNLCGDCAEIGQYLGEYQEGEQTGSNWKYEIKCQEAVEWEDSIKSGEVRVFEEEIKRCDDEAHEDADVSQERG